MNDMYVVNEEGFLIDSETGEVIDDFSYRVVYDTPPADEIIVKRKETVQTPKVDVKKYLGSLLTPRLREEFLSRVDSVNNKAEIFAHFLALCREYGLLYDFNRIREKLGISKISLRRARKKLLLTSSPIKEQIDRLFFEIADNIERKYWLSAVLLAIEYQRRQMKVSVDDLKRHLQVEIPRSNNYIKHRLLNNETSLVLVYPYFAYLTCPHGRPAKIDYAGKYFFVRHLGGKKKHDYCFTVTTKKVQRLLNIMEQHIEAVKYSTKAQLQLSEEHKYR